MRWFGLVAVLAVVLVSGRPGYAGAQQFALDMKLTLDRTAYDTSAAISFTLAITNVTKNRVTMQFATSERFDLVMQASVAEVSRWSDSHVFVPAIEQVNWEPGETKAFRDTWTPVTRIAPSGAGVALNQFVAPGLYTIYPELTNVGTHTRGAALPLVIGQPFDVDAGCTPIPNGFQIMVTAAFFMRTIDPLGAVQSIWRYDFTTGRYAGFSPKPTVPPNDLMSINPGDHLVMCIGSPGRVLVPS